MFDKQIEKEYDKLYNRREDDKHLLKYFMPDDFKDMKKEKISFKSDKGQTLNGYLFFKSNIDSHKNLVLFLHGAGGGYLSYMNEIHELVTNGFLVMTYDYTGTFSSEGETLVGFSQPLVDIEFAFKFIDLNPKLKNKNIYLVGHSWGAYTALNALSFKNSKVKKVVALAPVLSTKDALNAFTKGVIRLFAVPKILKLEKAKFGALTTFNARDVINNDCDMLIIASKDDNVIPACDNFKVLEKLNEKENHKFILVNHRLHNPNYTKDAANYLNFKISEFKKKVKSKELDTFDKQKAYFAAMDFKRASKQDKTVWDAIINFLGDR